MAEDNEEQSAAADGGSGSKKNLIIIIVIVLLAMAISVGGTLFMLGFFDSSGSETLTAEDDPEAAVAVNKPAAAIYFPIKPAFVVNFPARGRQRYLQVDVTVLTRDIAIFDAMQRHMPLIKNRLNMLMGGEIYEELQTDEGKELLRQKALLALQEIMQAEVGSAGVEEVLFTNFVMQ